MVDLIDVKYCDDRDDWLKIVCAMKKCIFTEEEVREWSMKSDRFSDEGFSTTWEHYDIDFITAREGTIRHYAKLSNPTEYNNMTAKDNSDFPTDPTDRDFAELFWKLAGDCCIVSSNTMYLFYKNQWRVIDKKEPHILRTVIGMCDWRYHFATINYDWKEYFEKQLSITKDKKDMKEYLETI